MNNVITYCSGNFTDCLGVALPSWLNSECDVTICTDSPEKLKRYFGHLAKVVGLHTEQSTSKRVNCMRKIDTIQYAAEHFEAGTRYAWLDSDCIIRRPFFAAIGHNQATVICTRMVVRDYPYKSINAGVSFWMAGQQATKFCNEWRAIAEKLRPTENLNEQVAFHRMCYKYFDKESDVKVSTVSEVLFNCERDNDDDFRRQIASSNPFIVHLKGGRWKRIGEFIK